MRHVFSHRTRAQGVRPLRRVSRDAFGRAALATRRSHPAVRCSCACSLILVGSHIQLIPCRRSWQSPGCTHRKLRAACLAAELLARADAKEAQPSTVLSDASETPIASGDLLGDGDSDGEYDVPHLPPRIRARYLELLLEWAISTLVKGSNGALKGGSLSGVGKGSARKRARDVGVGAAAAADTKFTARPPPHHDARLWRLLRRLLAAGTPAAAVALSEGLLPTMTAACDSLPPEAEGGRLPCPLRCLAAHARISPGAQTAHACSRLSISLPMPAVHSGTPAACWPSQNCHRILKLLLTIAGDVGALLVEVLRLLMTEYRASFRPSLEHTASFVAALLPGAAPERQQRRQGAAAWAELTCQALRLLKVKAGAVGFAPAFGVQTRWRRCTDQRFYCGFSAGYLRST